MIDILILQYLPYFEIKGPLELRSSYATKIFKTMLFVCLYQERGTLTEPAVHKQFSPFQQ